MNIIKRYIAFRVVNTSGGGSGGGTWGSITGTLSNQTDLQAALDLKADKAISVLSQSSTSTLTPTTYDAYEITAQASSLTISNPSPDYSNFDGFVIRIKDNGTARALSFGSKYRAQGIALPTTTTLGKVMIITCLRDSTGDKYDTRFTEEV